MNSALERDRRESNLIRWLLLLFGALLSLRAAPSSFDDHAREYKVKAGYLINFGRFVEWPAEALPANNTPFVISVLDAGEAYPAVHSVLDGKSVNGHPVTVKTASTTNFPPDTHILLVTRASRVTAEQARALMGSAPILLVGEGEDFAERGGMIGFVVEKESVRLTACLEHAAKAGVKIGARLASIAKLVKSKQNGNGRK